MKTILTLVAILLFHFTSFANHLYCGYISAKRITGRKYEITTVIMNDPSSPASQYLSSIVIFTGDGDSVIMPRTSLFTSEANFGINTFVTTHEYQSDGVFSISYNDPNLADNIININGGNSDNTSLNLKCSIRISSTLGPKENLHPLAYTLPNATFHHPFTYNPSFINTEADSLTYQLSQANEVNLPNYILPPGDLNINPYSGMITWKNPLIPGLFLIEYTVKSYRQGMLVSTSTVVQMIRVVDVTPPFNTPTLSPVADWVYAGWYRSIVSQQTDSIVQSFSVPLDNYVVDVFSELIELGGRVESTTTSTQRITTIHWSPTSILPKSTPYFVTYRLRASDFVQVSIDYNLAFYHGASITTGLIESNAKGLLESTFKLYPNPTQGNCTIQLPIEHLKITVNDALGQEHLTTETFGSTYTLDTKYLSKGLYFVHVILDNGNSEMQKLIIE